MHYGLVYGKESVPKLCGKVVQEEKKDLQREIDQQEDGNWVKKWRKWTTRQIWERKKR